MSYSRRRSRSISHGKNYAKYKRQVWVFFCDTIALLSLCFLVYAFAIVAYVFNTY